MGDRPPRKDIAGGGFGAGLPAAVWTLGFVSLLMDVSSELIHSLLPVFLVSGLGASVAAVGLIEGAAEATALIVKVFSGGLSDYWGKRKPLTVAGYGLGALSKPLFALAAGAGMVLTARLIDRTGKGIRGAPRDALLADVTPPAQRGAAFGLRQALDSIGAFLGPLLAMGLMLWWANDFRAVFWAAAIPAFLAVGLLVFGLREPDHGDGRGRVNPLRREQLRQLSGAYWRVVAVGGLVALARFSEAFLILRAHQAGLPLALTPLVLIGMNLVYAASAYPFGRLSDSVDHRHLLALSLLTLIGADLALAASRHWLAVGVGVALWGLHMGMSQGLLSRMVADTAGVALRGTAFGLFNLVGGLMLLASSSIAGLLWDALGSTWTFAAGAVFASLALAAETLPRKDRRPG
jgi:MFS family permease